MSSLKNDLLQKLQAITGLQALPSQVAGGLALFHDGKELAHFHHDHELDLRLGKALIRSLRLSHPPRSEFHPARSPSSNWIELRFHTSEDVDRIVELVGLAAASR